MKDTLILIACIIILAMLAFIAWQFVVPTKFIIDTDAPVACTADAKECSDGSFVGRIGPDCEFAECPLVEEPPLPTNDQIACTDEMKQADVCIEIFAPVCAQVQVECITTPCEPVAETFSNSCFACANDRVLSYTNGACAGDETPF